MGFMDGTDACLGRLIGSVTGRLACAMGDVGDSWHSWTGGLEPSISDLAPFRSPAMR